ncbi:MAG: hypothetical protein AMXMBFR7_14890 [Planctomycetota bacterium]
MDREAILLGLDACLDGAADEPQREALDMAVRSDRAIAELCAEYRLQDALLTELFVGLPELATPQWLLERAKKRARIVEASGEAAPLVLSTPPAAKTAAPTRAPTPGKAQTRGGRKARTRGTDGLRPVGGANRAWLGLIGVAAAALVALVIYLTRNPEKPAEPDVVQQPAVESKTPEAKTPEQTPPPKPAEPIVAIKGGAYTREGNTLTTDRVSAIVVTLADGSEVEMQPLTKVSFAVPTPEVRQDLDLSQGLLKVKAVPNERLFRVRAGAGEITVVGTRFVVERAAREQLSGDQQAPARVEVAEGSVRLKNEKGELVVEREQTAVLSAAFAPQAAVKPQAHDLLGFSGKMKVAVLHKDRQRLLVMVAKAEPDRENKLERAGDRIAHKILWLYPAPERQEEAHEAAQKMLEEVKVMDDPYLSVWSFEGRLVFVPVRK